MVTLADGRATGGFTVKEAAKKPMGKSMSRNGRFYANKNHVYDPDNAPEGFELVSKVVRNRKTGLDEIMQVKQYPTPWTPIPVDAYAPIPRKPGR
jgi:hypothetical protein